MKPKPLIDDFPKIAIDQSAQTFADLLKAWPGGECGLRQFIQKQVQAGAWERVKKKVGGKFMLAFRRSVNT